MKKRNSLKLWIIGFIFLFFGIGAWINYIITLDLNKIFWMCYLSLIIMGIGALRKNSYAIMSQVYILAMPLLIWDIDFIFRLVSGQTLWGISDYFFLGHFVFEKVIVLQHLFSIPLAIYAAKIIGVERKDAWKISIFQIAIVYFAVFLVIPNTSNINCIFSPCVSLPLGFSYVLTWFLVFFGMTLFSALIINNILLKKN